MVGTVAGVISYIHDRINTNELNNKKFIEYTQAFIKLEGNISQEISDDTRLTRSVMLYRRDLLDGIRLRAEDLGFKDEVVSPCSCIYSQKSQAQIMSMLCAEFGNIHAEFVEDLRKSKIFSLSGEEIIINVVTDEAIDRIKAASGRIDEVFAIFGLKPIFYADKNALSELIW